MNPSFKEITVCLSSTDPTERLDKVLSTHSEIKTRSQAQKIIDMKLVKVNGSVAKASQKIGIKDIIIVQLPIKDDNSQELKPYDIKLDIVFEDDDLMVINKPAGLVVHPAQGHNQDTLVNAVINKLQGLSLGVNEKRPGIVHRLDKETSGLIVVAKNDVSYLNLAEQFKNKTARRHYWALVHGNLSFEQKTIESFLIRHPKDRKRFCSDKFQTGKFAKTHISLLQNYLQNVAWIECELETGRTHQIRVHCKELAHPILGDIKYSSEKRDKKLSSHELKKSVINMNRIALHAFKLEITHPTQEKPMQFECAWPEDLQNIVNQLKESV